MNIIELIKKRKKELNTHWDKSFYGKDLDTQEMMLLGWVLKAIESQSNPKLDRKFWEREQMFCEMQLFRVYQSIEKRG